MGSPWTDECRPLLRRRLQPGLQPRLQPADTTSTDGVAIGFDEPAHLCARILPVMSEARPVLANDDGVRSVYAAHGPELYRFALRSLGDRGLAEEAVQETFVRAWQAANRFEEMGLDWHAGETRKLLASR